MGVFAKPLSFGFFTYFGTGAWKTREANKSEPWDGTFYVEIAAWSSPCPPFRTTPFTRKDVLDAWPDVRRAGRLEVVTSTEQGAARNRLRP